MITLSRAAVEGSLALPRMRPLGNPTLSFGGEWRVTMPKVDFRAELPALYAAVLHTFCVNPRRGRAASKPEAPREPKAAAPAPVSSHAASPVARPAPVIISSSYRERMAGGVCALTGAVLLSWIILSHMPPDEPVLGPSATEYAEPAEPAEPGEPAPSVAATRTETSSADRHSAAANVVRSAVGAPSDDGATPSDAAGAPSADDRATRHRQPIAADAARRQHGGSTARTADRVAHVAQLVKPPAATPPSTHPPVIAHRSTSTGGAPMADLDALPQPIQQADDSHAPVASSMRPIARDSGASAAASRTAGTSWIADLSHRRVTEVPDQFAM
jgi:hypothetical protein